MEVAADIVNLMLAHRPDIAQRMSDAGASRAIIPKDGYITEIPELSHLQGRLDPNGNPYDSFRVRGAGGTPGQTTIRDLKYEEIISRRAASPPTAPGWRCR